MPERLLMRPSSRSSKPQETEMDGQSGKGNILIVGDTLLSVDMLRTVLEGEGYGVIVATSGEKALQRAELKTPDLILMDVLLPGMDGFETCRRLKTQENTGEIPVIFITTPGVPKCKVKGFEAGGVDYVTKPIEVEDVLAKVRTHLTFRTMHRELEAQNERLQQEVAERRQAEEEVRRLNTELEQKMEQRTSELNAANNLLQGEIEERKRAEKAIKESEEKFRVLSDQSLLGILIIQNGKIQYVNRTTSEICGYPIEEMMNWGPNAFSKVVHPDDLPFVMEQARRKQLGEPDIITSYSWRAITKSGAVKWIESYSRTIPYGNSPADFAMMADITERKRAEEGLKESEEWYRVATENSNDGIAIVKADQYLFVNQKVLEIFGYDRREEIVGQPIFKLAHPDDRDRLIDINRKRQRGEILPTRYEFKGIRKDGGEVFTEVSVAITTYRGEIVFLAFLRDITERKKLESLLQQAQKMEAIGTLAGGIAHDFNNILAVILGGVELSILGIPKESPAHSYLIEVLKATERATDLVQQILTFSRKKELERKPLQLGIICKEALKMLRASIPTTIEIQQDIVPKSGIALVDPTQIHQIIMNLCSNAAHAMQEKGGLLRFSLRNIDFSHEDVPPGSDLIPGPYLNLTISDTGYGIEPTVLKRIFDPYFTTKGIGEGSGLGLAVVHGIVKGYKGAIQVHSELGKGTTFQVYIPRIESAKGLQMHRKAKDLPRGTERILWVDDEESIIRFGKMMLGYLGYEVVGTTSSLEALEIIKGHPKKFDLVITDYTMPKMTGTELAREIIRIRPEIPIILITGLGEFMTADQKEAAGIRKAVMKPLEIHSLAEKVREVLDQERLVI
jgi:PAS domain S-box-containing protein